MPYVGRTPSAVPVTADDIPANSIDASKIIDGAIAVADVADNAITEAKIADAAVVSLKSGRKNLIINGAMQVAQRGTSATGLSSAANSGYNSVDRMKFMFSGTAGTVWTQEQSTDSPPNFQYSLKTTATTGSAIAADNLDRLEYFIEADEVHQFGYGTTTPKTSTLSFWTKSNKTGNFTVSIYNQNSTRLFTSSVTINTAATWEYKTITIPGDTVALTGTSSAGLRIFITYGAGSNYASGTKSLDTWGTSLDSAMLYKDGTLDIGSSTNDYFSITGVQLELGSVATDFEHRSYGEELALCQRYYWSIKGGSTHIGLGRWESNLAAITIFYPTEMRNKPTFSIDTNGLQCVVPRIAWHNVTAIQGVHQSSTKSVELWISTVSTGANELPTLMAITGAGTGWIAADAEL